MVTREPIWKHEDFPHYYHNPAAVAEIGLAFREELDRLMSLMDGNDMEGGISEVLTEETLKNSRIEGVELDRESVRSSFLNNLPIKGSRESGAVAVTRMALENLNEPLGDDLIKQMHQRLFDGSDMPDGQRGAYLGDVRLVSGRRLDQEPVIEDLGMPRDRVDQAMGEFVAWFNRESEQDPLTKAIQGHLHFEAIHPFADGNGRIGRALMQRSLSRDLGRSLPLALSRVFYRDSSLYYRQFKTGLDLTGTIKELGPVMIEAVKETVTILEVTRMRGVVLNSDLNERQKKVMSRLIHYELSGKEFEGGLNNRNYRKMTSAEEKTAQRDLRDLVSRKLLLKSGRLKGTRYRINIPSKA